MSLETAVLSAPPIRLQVFPSEDTAFRRFADAALTRVRVEATGSDLGLDPADLQHAIRDRYPAAVVRARDSLADPGYGEIVWYVYRFGSVTAGRHWWEEPGHAWAILDEHRQFAEVSTSLLDIVEVPREAIIGRRVEELANPDDVSAAEDVAALWAEMLLRGELHATLRYRRLDGAQREIEYHVTREAAGPGRHLAVVREIDPS